MSLTTTTASAAITASATSITVASATGFSAGYLVRVDEEFMRVSKTYTSGTSIPLDGRGLNGSAVVAHPSGVNVTVGTGSDWANPSASVVPAYPLAARRRKVLSYSASGAIDLPTSGEDIVAIINGTGALDMTVAAPGKDNDGAVLYVVANGAAAHTVTFAGGFGGAGTSYDKLTLAADPVLIIAMAVNGLWVFPIAAAITGTVTNITAGIG